MPPRLNVLWNDQTDDHLARHGVTLDEALETVANYTELWRLVGNRYMLVGRSYSGRYITVILERDDWRQWHMVTARPSNHRERRRIRRRR